MHGTAAAFLAQVQPDEIYNLGAMSHVKVSFEMSEYTAECDGVGVLRLLNAIRSAGLEKKTRLYQVPGFVVRVLSCVSCSGRVHAEYAKYLYLRHSR